MKIPFSLSVCSVTTVPNFKHLDQHTRHLISYILEKVSSEIQAVMQSEVESYVGCFLVWMESSSYVFQWWNLILSVTEMKDWKNLGPKRCCWTIEPTNLIATPALNCFFCKCLHLFLTLWFRTLLVITEGKKLHFYRN